MKQQKSMFFYLPFAVLLLGLSACEKREEAAGRGPAEKTGEQVDRAAAKAGEELNKVGERAGELLQRAGEKGGEAAQRAGEKLEEASREAQRKE